jgi:hypothetical protein
LYTLFTAEPSFSDVKYAKCFADFVEPSVWERYREETTDPELPLVERQALVQSPDEELVKEIVAAFSANYPYGGTENLPVKSSATAVMRERDEPREFEKEY